MRIIEGGELMVEHKCILSEKPDALDGALEWLQAEIKRLETENDKKKKLIHGIGGRETCSICMVSRLIFMSLIPIPQIVR